MTPFGNLNLVFVGIVIAALVHVAEEHLGGFVESVARISALRITREEFWIVNALFILLCIAAALSGDHALWLRMSVVGLIAVNAVVHVIGALRLRGYAPGMISAVVFYIPLASYAYHLASRTGLIERGSWSLILLLGVAWHLIPLTLHLVRQRPPLHTR